MQRVNDVEVTYAQGQDGNGIDHILLGRKMPGVPFLDQLSVLSLQVVIALGNLAGACMAMFVRQEIYVSPGEGKGRGGGGEV